MRLRTAIVAAVALTLAAAAGCKSSQYFADFDVAGTVSGNELTFRETDVVDQTPPPSSGFWCTKNGTLQMSASPRSLTGPWASSNCANGGTIELH